MMLSCIIRLGALCCVHCAMYIELNTAMYVRVNDKRVKRTKITLQLGFNVLVLGTDCALHRKAVDSCQFSICAFVLIFFISSILFRGDYVQQIIIGELCNAIEFRFMKRTSYRYRHLAHTHNICGAYYYFYFLCTIPDCTKLMQLRR